MTKNKPIYHARYNLDLSIDLLIPRRDKLVYFGQEVVINYITFHWTSVSILSAKSALTRGTCMSVLQFISIVLIWFDNLSF